MFASLSSRLGTIFTKLTGRGLLTQEDVDAALREVRLALLEADVALPAVKKLTELVRARAVGEALLKSIKPGDMVVKIVNDALVELLGEGEELNLRAQAPVVILMAGLQGSGKTTTSGKLSKLLQNSGKKVLLASLDIYRPAAQQQLETLAQRVGCGSLPIVAGEEPLAITKRALNAAKTGGYDVLILDSAGRTELNDDLMRELVQVRDLALPTETLLVADSLMGQAAATVAKAFHEQVGVTGIILTRVDGDGRGGAALSMREVTGCPLKFLGMGEDVAALEPFRPEGMANRILGMGDVVSLVEKVQAAASQEDMQGMEERMMSGQFDLTDLRKQLSMMKRMGSMKGMMGLLPGVGKMLSKVDESKMDDKVIVRQMAIIDSMTAKERKNPAILNARRRMRIAKGAGVEVSDVNKLMKAYEQMAAMMKKLKTMGPAGLMGLMGRR